MKIKDKLLPFITVAIVLIVWFIAAEIYNVEIILPRPKTVAREFAAALFEGEFWRSVGNTMLRPAVAFAIAFVAALLLSLAATASKGFYRLFYPVVVFLRALPTISVIFVCYIAVKGWFRAVIIAFLIIFPTLFSSFYTAFDSTNGELAEVGRVFGVKPINRLVKFVIPSVWTYMYSDIINTLSLSVKLIVAAEAVTSTRMSLGGLMADSKMNIDMGRIFAYTVVAVVLSYASELLVRGISRIVKEVSRKCRLH